MFRQAGTDLVVDNDEPENTNQHLPKETTLNTMRVTVIYKEKTVDVTVPSSIPVILLPPALHTLLTTHESTETDLPKDSGHSIVPPPTYFLSQVTGQPLEPHLGLQEQGIIEGDYLLLEEDVPTQESSPIFDDPIAATTDWSVEGESPWKTEDATWSGLVAASMGYTILLFWCAMHLLSSGVGSISIAILAELSSLVLLGVSPSLQDQQGKVPSAFSGLLACLASGIAGYAIPYPHNASLRILASCGAILVTSTIAHKLCGEFHGLFRGIFFFSISFGGLAGMGKICGLAPEAVASVAIVLGLFICSYATQIGIIIGRLPAPEVPGPHEELDDIALDTNSISPEQFKHSLGTSDGVIVSSTLLISIGAWQLAFSSPSVWSKILLGVSSLVLLLRARDGVRVAPTQTLFFGGIVTAFAAVSAISAVDTQGSLTILLSTLFTFCTLLEMLSLYSPHVTASPTLRKAVELLEGFVTASIIPVAVMSSGIYSMIRMR